MYAILSIYICICTRYKSEAEPDKSILKDSKYFSSNNCITETVYYQFSTYITNYIDMYFTYLLCLCKAETKDFVEHINDLLKEKSKW